MELSEETGRALLEIACNQIRLRLGGEASAGGAFADPALARPAGCFVSVHDRRTHALRGCIGLLESERPLLETLVNAAQGVLKDPRFVMQPIELEELAELEVEITVLDPMRVAMSPLDFDPAVHGIFLTIGGQGGCFLPQVARETGWGREQLLGRLCTEKLGMSATAWRERPAELRTFTAKVFGPRGF